MLNVKLEGQKMFQILKRAKELEANGKDILHFEIGDPDFNTPENIKASLIKEIDNNNTHYTISQGLTEFRELASEITKKSRGFAPDIKQILVTPGANIHLYYVCKTILSDNDEVLTTDPCFVSYDSILNLFNIKNKKIKLYEKNNFVIDVDEIEKNISQKTKLIVLNSPHNPTGSVIDKKTFLQIYEIIKSKGIYLFSDEVYARMVYKDINHFDLKNRDPYFYSPSTVDECKNLVFISQSFSKSYSMTGWRLGAITGPEEIINQMTLLQETLLSCVPPFIQKAAMEGMKNSSSEVTQMIKIYKERRDLIVEGLNSISGFNCLVPEGAFYVFPNISKINNDSVKFGNYLLDNLNIASCPGIYFGKKSDGYLRFCYANSKENILRLIDRLKKFNE